MSLFSRATRSFTIRQFSGPRILQTQRYYAQDSSESAEEGSGVQQKAEKGAKPKILEHAPPAEESDEVRKHNQEFEKRPDRAANMIDDENKVKKGFWAGQGGADRES